VWAMVITFLPLARGFVYLASEVDPFISLGAGLAAVGLYGEELLHRSGGRTAGLLRSASDRQ
jgi:hypothetical protein